MPVVRSPARTLGEAQRAWREAHAVCLDVDSTVIQVEAIDQLAQLCGAGEEVSKLTQKAMGGSMTFREALSARLDIIKPSKQQVREFSRLHTPEKILTPGVEDLVRMLHRRGTAVFLVSGGFRQLIEPVAECLSVPKDRIFANLLLFNDDGQFSGFDVSQPTSQSGGKPRVVHMIKEQYNLVVMVGDGATDMEASPPADAFIGFGGNVVREKVKAGAAWFVYSFQELVDQLAPPENCERKANGFVLQHGLQGTRNGAKHQTTDGFADGQICSRRLTNGLTEEST